MNRALADSVLALDDARTDSVARRGMADGTTPFLAPDAVYLRAGQPIVFGRERVQRMLAAAPVPAGAAVRWQAVRSGVSADGLAGYTVGIAASVDAASTAPRLDRYIAYWTRARGGDWRLAAYAEVGSTPTGTETVSDAGVPPMYAGVRDSMFRVLAATDSAFSALAGRAGLAAAFGDYADEDAMVFGGHRFVMGPAAIRELNAGPDGGTLSWHAVAGQAAASADLGFTVGEYTFTPASGRAPSHGKYLTIWVSAPGRGWRYVADGGNSNP